MNVWAWIALAWVALGVVVSVAHIGKEREPVTPGVAALSLFFSGPLAWVIVLAATV